MSGLQNSRNPSLADYDLRKFASALRAHRANDSRGLSVIGDEIGVTISDLSRAMGGQMVSVGKVIALCRWLGVSVEKFYLEPEKPSETEVCTGANVKRLGESEGARA
ncbi:hypothetical protein [Neorhizobium sp. NCHU2750]|uniref:hypothetical protein n=1 Tax=Neorhizobium sp. NCHU2750 TaxID=1825976 RepID=UPI000E73F4A6|nr:hypothetical protein NCHU2750_06120 [Neorhizobium sp. NCHU2750]